MRAVKVVEEDVDFSLNDLLLRGRVSAPAIEKELPSGDRVVEFRLIVRRDRAAGVDTLDIAAWSTKTQKRALTLKPNEWVEILGSVRRRFYKGKNGLESRWQVEALEIARI